MASFNSAFAAARKAGKATFTWQGKSYTTKLKEEVAPKRREEKSSAAPKSSPRPKTRSSGSESSHASRMNLNTSGPSRAAAPTGERLVTRRAGSTEDKKTNTGSARVSKPAVIPAKVWSEMTLIEKREFTMRRPSNGSGPGTAKPRATAKVAPTGSVGFSLTRLREKMGWNKPAPKK